jgi:hypothetical protein
MAHRHRFLIGTLVAVALAVLVLISPGGEGAIAQGGILYVDAAAMGANDGSSWADAYTNLQDALDNAGTDNQIWVAEGIYKPTQLFVEGDLRSAAFQMKNGVAIYGGFAGTEELLDDRDWVNHVTILSGDLNGDDGPDFANNGENSYHVLYNPGGTGMDSSAVLDGFTITAGNADFIDLFPNFYGGGMYNYYSSPMLNNCTFEGNSSAYVGGGMANLYSSPALTNCTFRDNSAGSYGGGMYNGYDTSSPTLIESTFEGNSANEGGGMYNEYGASPTLTGCIFGGNSASSGWGGGMYNFWESSPVVTNCTFLANIGGGMANSYSSAPMLTNCIFDGNSAGFGGGMRNSESSPTLTNCIFWGNSAMYGGSGIYNWDYSSPSLINCILWGHTYPVIENSLDSEPAVTYSDVEGYYSGVGNVSIDPQFVDQANGNFHLGICSPCIDAGTNGAPYLPLYDFEGDDRIVDGDGDGSAVVDMGVDEFVYAGPPVIEVEIDIRPDSDQNVINLGSGGVVPVAILTTDDFDAGTVRPASVLFAGAAPRRWTMEDVDRDGDLDLLLNFKIRDLELDANSTEATLTGETFPHAGGVLIEGTDGVRIVL